ncbi:MAG: hypothetical protein ACPG8W_06035 [Candidatus Promineifilaceae bacterium]
MIGTLNEKSLHASLKLYLEQAGDRFEVPLDGFFIDIVRGGELIEIQTGSFNPLKKKLRKLTQKYKVRLVYPIAVGKWIVKDTEPEKRRKSPKRGNVYSLFEELVYIPDLLNRPNFTLELLLIHQEDTRTFDAKRARRRRKGWVTAERKLIKVLEHRVFENTADLLTLIPTPITDPFTTADLAQNINQPRKIAQQMCYCLRHLDVIELIGKQGRANLYQFK